MQSSNRVSITQAANMVGLTRATLYKHIEEKGISIIKTGNSHPKIDVSELIRVYGDNLKLPEQKTDRKPGNYTKEDKNIQKADNSVELALLQQKLEHIEELKHSEVKRLEDQISLLEKMLESEKEEKNKINLLLTDQRGKADQTDRWGESLKALESRIDNQDNEKEALRKQNEELLKLIKDREAKEEKLREEQEQKEAEAKKKAEEELEAAQTWVSKMFGKKKTA